MDWPLRFGIFLAPFNPVGQNPTLALEKDLELIRHLDRLGFDEAWVGEHHSGGFEIISSPEVFIAVASQQTRHIKLGTGVSSLPYHHPFMLTDRMVLLDHLTRGRVMFGVGPGQLTSDAHMLGISPDNQRRMMEESLEAIMALLAAEGPVTRETDWFVMRDARLQLRPYSYPRFDMAVAASISPSGPKVAGRHGLGLLSIAATNPLAFELLAQHWQVMEEQAAEYGSTVDRRNWRMMGPMHLADTEEQALANCRFGLERILDYLGHVVPTQPSEATSYEEIVAQMNETGAGVIGTAAMAVEQIERLWKQSGGFGTYLLFGGEIADREATLRSYEIFARDVMPHFQGQIQPVQASYDWVMGAATESGATRWVEATTNAIAKATEEYMAERAKKPGS
jgi:limonene 1,2-monooxygenase